MGPKPVPEPTVDNIKETTATVSWTESTDPVDGYEVDYTDSSGQTQTVKVPAGQTSTELSNLTPDSGYSVKVFAVKDGTRSTASPAKDFKTLAKGK